MAELTIYDSRGHQYGTGGSGADGNEKIKRFFFGGVKLAIDSTGREDVIVSFFRAREESGRSEQYYAVYKTPSSPQLLTEFKNAVESWVRERGMTLNTSLADVAVFANLHRKQQAPGSRDHGVIQHLLGQGRNLTFGVGSYKDALGLVQEFHSVDGVNRIAISDKGRIDELTGYDLVIEQGSYRGLRPLDGTERLMKEGQRNQQEQLLRRKVSTIQSEIRELQQQTTYSDRDIKNTLERKVPLLDTEGSPASTASTRSLSTSSSKSRVKPGKNNLLKNSRLPLPQPTAKQQTAIKALLFSTVLAGILYVIGSYVAWKLGATLPFSEALPLIEPEAASTTIALNISSLLSIVSEVIVG